MADWLADRTGIDMAKVRASRLHLLTTKQVQAADDGDHSDGGGLLLRVRGTSSSWVLRFTAPAGRRREMGLGVANRANAATCGDALTTARRQAHEARELLAQGVDPIDTREHRKRIAKSAEEVRNQDRDRERWTLARCARDYHERVIEPSRTAKHAAQWIASLENHVPRAVWNKPAGEIEPPELLQALQQIKPHERARNLTGKKPQETVQRVRQRLDAVFEDAIFHKRCTSNPAAAIRRKMREAAARGMAGHFRALQYLEAPAFMAKLRQMPGTAARCLEFAVLTGSRTSDVLGANWDEFDLIRGVWIIPKERMKMREPHTVYLSQRAQEVIAGQIGRHSFLLFPSGISRGMEGPGPMSNMAMLNVLTRMGMRQHTTVHGLCRATFSTWANETNAARGPVIEACLAHREQDLVKAAYNRAEFMQERQFLMDAWARYLEAASVKVVPLRRA